MDQIGQIMPILIIYAGHMSPGTLCEEHISPERCGKCAWYLLRDKLLFDEHQR